MTYYINVQIRVACNGVVKTDTVIATSDYLTDVADAYVDVFNVLRTRALPHIVSAAEFGECKVTYRIRATQYGVECYAKGVFGVATWGKDGYKEEVL